MSRTKNVMKVVFLVRRDEKVGRVELAVKGSIPSVSVCLWWALGVPDTVLRGLMVLFRQYQQQ